MSGASDDKCFNLSKLDRMQRLGRIERCCLDALALTDCCDAISIAGWALKRSVITSSEHSSFRRALRSLFRKGLVKECGRSFEPLDGPHGHRATRVWYLSSKPTPRLRLSARQFARKLHVSPSTICRDIARLESTS